MSLWNDSPRLSGPPQTEDLAVVLDYVKQLANTVAKMAKDLEFILNGNVAFDNIRAEGIEAKNIKAEAITTDKLQANSITTNKIQAGAVTAEKITVNQLSAISANLGHITAGLIEAVEIIGAYIYGTVIEGGSIRGSTVSTRVGNSKGIVMKSEWADLEVYSGVSGIGLTFAIEDLANDAGLWFARDGKIRAGRTLHLDAPDGVFVNGVQIG